MRQRSPWSRAEPRAVPAVRGMQGWGDGHGARVRSVRPGRIAAVPAPVVITDPSDPRVADFRNLKAGDRPEGTPRWGGPVIVEGVSAVARLLDSDYRVRAVFGVPGRVAALDLPDDVPAFEADKWVLSEVIGFRLTR